MRLQTNLKTLRASLSKLKYPRHRLSYVLSALKRLILKARTPEEMSLSATEDHLDSTHDQDLPVQPQSISHLPDSLKDFIRKQLGTLPTTASILSHPTVAAMTYSASSKHSGNSYARFT